MCLPAEVADPAEEGRWFLGGRVNEASISPSLATLLEEEAAVARALACGSEDAAFVKLSLSCFCWRTGRTVLVASFEEAAAAALTCGSEEIPKKPSSFDCLTGPTVLVASLGWEGVFFFPFALFILMWFQKGN